MRCCQCWANWLVSSVACHSVGLRLVTGQMFFLRCVKMCRQSIIKAMRCGEGCVPVLPAMTARFVAMVISQCGPLSMWSYWGRHPSRIGSLSKPSRALIWGVLRINMAGTLDGYWQLLPFPPWCRCCGSMRPCSTQMPSVCGRAAATLLYWSNMPCPSSKTRRSVGRAPEKYRCKSFVWMLPWWLTTYGRHLMSFSW